MEKQLRIMETGELLEEDSSRPVAQAKLERYYELKSQLENDRKAVQDLELKLQPQQRP